MKLFFTSLLCVLATACQSSPSTTVSPKPSDRTTCKQLSDERTVEIVPSASKGCHVQYTKFAKAKTIAQAQGEKEFCVKIKERIVTNLTNSGFICE